MKFDRIIYNGIVITVNPDFEIIEDGLVCIKDGVIQSVEVRNKDISQYRAVDFVDANGGIVMPGLINAHVHLPMSLFRGLADDLPLGQWLNDYIFPAEQKHISPETVQIGTLLSCVEMILSGTTACCDGYFYEDDVAQAVFETGLRAVTAQGVIDYPAPGVPEPVRNVETAVEFVKKWKNRSPLITPSIFCHSLYTCSADTLKKAKQAADSLDVRFQIHVAETKGEADQAREAHSMSPVKYLDSLGIINDNTLISHAVWVDDEDIEVLANRNARIAHCPESNMKLASGVAPVPNMIQPDVIQKGITVGLGTDGCASNNNLDLFEEMDSAAKLHKVFKSDPTVMDAKTVVKMATIEGAKAIGIGDLTGSLEPGKQADIIIIDINKPHLTPMYHPESHLVYAVHGSDVSDVFVSGKALMRNYKPVCLDVDDIMEQAVAVGLAVQRNHQ
ncbi:MAG: amidohydrolase [Desulfobacteraceae bacterium]|nr:amidohydrolase [Desulfobacteraceae bacterium]MBC2754264.1 amidohydrolase [Desulfobacteraceae bacterium]